MLMGQGVPHSTQTRIFNYINPLGQSCDALPGLSLLYQLSLQTLSTWFLIFLFTFVWSCLWLGPWNRAQSQEFRRVCMMKKWNECEKGKSKSAFVSSCYKIAFGDAGAGGRQDCEPGMRPTVGKLSMSSKCTRESSTSPERQQQDISLHKASPANSKFSIGSKLNAKHEPSHCCRSNSASSSCSSSSFSSLPHGAR